MKKPFAAYHQLRSTIKGLTKGQRNLMRKYLLAFESNLTSKKENKSVKLFNQLVKKPDLSIEKAMKLVEIDKKNSFDKFTTRILNKLFETLNLSFNTQSALYDSYFQTKLSGRNKMNQVAIAWGMGERERALDLLLEVVAQAKKHELYKLLVDAYEEWVWIQISLHEGENLGEMQNQLAEYRKLRDELAFATETYYTYRNNVQYSANRRESMVGFYLSMQRIKEAFEETGSNHIGYYFHQLMREYYEAVGDFVWCAKTADKLVALSDNAPQVVSNALIGLAYAAKAESELNLLRFDRAQELLAVSTVYFKLGNNLMQVNEAQATTHIYLGNIQQAQELLKWLLTKPYHKLSDFFVERCSYGLAATEFLMGNYSKCQRILPIQKAEIERDKAGWNFGQRLLAIMAAFEREDDELVYSHVAAAIKFVSRHKGQEVFRPRDLAFFDLFKTASTDGFDRSKVMANAPATIMQLERTSDDLRWEPMTHELVHFDSWLRHVCNGTPYVFQLPAALYERVLVEGEEFELRDAAPQKSRKPT